MTEEEVCDGPAAMKFCRNLELELCFVLAYRRLISFPIPGKSHKELNFNRCFKLCACHSNRFYCAKNKKWELFKQNETFSHKGFVFYYGKKVLKSFLFIVKQKG